MIRDGRRWLRTTSRPSLPRMTWYAASAIFPQIPWLRVFVQGVVIVGKLENYPCPRRSLALEFHQGQDAHAFFFQALAAAQVG